jgi:CheY-like chemotaxis protein
MSEKPASTSHGWKQIMARDFMLISLGALIIALTVSSVKSSETFMSAISHLLTLQVTEATILYCYLVVLFSVFVLQGFKGPAWLLRRKSRGMKAEADKPDDIARPPKPPGNVSLTDLTPEDQLRQEFNELSRKTAHDMGNLLTGIMGSISLIRMKLDKDNPLVDIIKDAETACTQANELTCQMREYGISLTEPKNKKKTVVLKNEKVKDCRILLVDDDEMVSHIAVDICESLGHTVQRAASGDEALKLFREASGNGGCYNLVITDLTLEGGMNGMDTFQLIREITPDVKGIITSGDSTDPIMREYANYGFNARLTKPFKVQDLGEAIDEAFISSPAD